MTEMITEETTGVAVNERAEAAPVVDAKPVTRDERTVTVRPRVDAYTADDRTVLHVDVPGVDESGLDVTLEKDVLTIVGTADAFAPEQFETSYREFPRRRFERSFRLNDPVERSGIEATVANGVLRLVLPKTAEAQPTKVTVTAAS